MNIVVTLLLLMVCLDAEAGTRNGFELDGASIPESEIVSGGPPRDGIPALTNPDFISAAEADYLDPDDRIMGLFIDGQAKAYPIKILNWHEIVNDSIGSQHFAVTYCPLCGSGMVFASNVGNDGALNFGVSGLLYNSDVLLYDRQTESLWSQLEGAAISGKLKGTELPQLPVLHTTWRDWRKKHPETLVLDSDTGFDRNYNRDPYGGYQRTRRLFFDVNHRAPDYHPKEQVLGLEIEGQFKAYPFQELSEHGKAQFPDAVAGVDVTIFWNEAERSAYAMRDGKMLEGTVAYWFAWYTFHPKTAVFTAED